MKLKELLADIDVLEANADLSMEIAGVSYDSRLTKPGDLFVAITGYETDGHRFIPAALEKGAACVLCQRRAKAPGWWCPTAAPPWPGWAGTGSGTPPPP